MANLNKVFLIGRLTRDPEVRSFASGGKVANLGFAVNNRKKNQQTGQWEDEPVWLDLKAFQGGQGRTVDLLEGNCRKGTQLMVEGHLLLDQWTDKASGEKRSKLLVIVDNFQFLDAKQGQGGEPRRQEQRGDADEGMAPVPAGRGDDDIPF